jgi:hypothetical protein
VVEGHAVVPAVCFGSSAQADHTLHMC